jgi:hypothetical protein
MDRIVLGIWRINRAGECQLAVPKAEILDRLVGVKAVRVSDALVSEAFHPSCRITIRVGRAGRKADRVQPFDTPIERTYYAVGVPSSKFPLPSVHPIGIKSWHFMLETSVYQNKKTPRSGRWNRAGLVALRRNEGNNAPK